MNFRSCILVYATTALCLVSVSRADLEEKILPIDPKYRWDRFSGVSLESENQAYSLILFRFAAAPRKGESVPDGILIDTESNKPKTVHGIVGDKPLVLIFGSSSCNQIQLFEKEFGPLYERFKEQVDFAFVYLRTAHPENGFQPETSREGVITETLTAVDAETTAQRVDDAQAFSQRLALPFPIYVDPVDDAIAVRWGAWPSRIFVINPDNTILYSGGPGPWHFQFTREGWHTPPPEALARIFQGIPFDRISLEEFLETSAAP